MRRHVDGLVAAGDDPDGFDVQVADGIPEMWVDADKLDQVLGNLLENAVRHGAGPGHDRRRARRQATERR